MSCAVSEPRTLSPVLGFTDARRLNPCRVRVGRRNEERAGAHGDRGTRVARRPSERPVSVAARVPCPRASPPPWNRPAIFPSLMRLVSTLVLYVLRQHGHDGGARRVGGLGGLPPSTSSTAASVGDVRLSLHVGLPLHVVGLLAAVGCCWSSRREEGSGGGQRRRSWRAAADSSPAVRGASACSRRRCAAAVWGRAGVSHAGWG